MKVNRGLIDTKEDKFEYIDSFKTDKLVLLNKKYSGVLSLINLELLDSQ